MKLVSEPKPDGALIRHKPGLLERTLVFTDWLGAADKTQVYALSQIQSLIDDRPELVRVVDGGVFLTHDCIAGLDETTALAIGLPSSTRLALRLRTKDQVMSPDFRVHSGWVKGGGVPARAERNGAFLQYGGRPFRIPEPIYSIIQAADGLGEPLPEEDRLRLYSALGEMLRADIDSEIVDLDAYLNGVSIYHAAAFSLQLGMHEDQFDFDPVLFSRETASEADDGVIIDEDDNSLLPPVYQELFAKKWFRRFDRGRSAYPLKDGSFVVLDPQLKRVMNAVRTAQSLDSEGRRAFISNPAKQLIEALGEEDGAALAALFIETEQFSQRVTGIDIWRAAVLPWIKPTPNSWIPESFGVRIGEDYVTLTPEAALEVQAQLDDARAVGESVIVIKDANGARHTLPVTDQAIQAVSDIADIARAVDQRDPDGPLSPSDDDGPLPDILKEKRFLTVHENFEDVDFQAMAGVEPMAPENFGAPDFGGLKSTLKPHQVEGVGWMWAALSGRLPGILLADDMGLGKTLQVLAFIRAARCKYREPALIVAPTGLLANWRREIALHFSADAFPYIVEAFGKNLRSLRRSDGPGNDTSTGQDLLDSSRWADADIVFTTYETMRDFHFSFAKTKFGIIAFDEIQKLKNPTSQMSRASRSLNGRMSIGMTGTPVENRLQDLWSIADVLWPGKLGSSKSFEQTYPATSPEKLEALRCEVFEAQAGEPPFALRRMKSDQLDCLPDKIEHADEVPMPELQASEYQKSVIRARAMKDGVSAGDSMLRILHELRMISLHPRRPDIGSADIAAYAAESARLTRTFEILTEVKAKNEKALIFLESLEMQSFLASAIQKHFGLPERPQRIHGGVTGATRQDYVDHFQSKQTGFDVLILSPKAGGVGLTLTAANHVIHLTRWWNPAVEDQSTDRAYRIGQNKPVHVYYPMAVHPSPAMRASSFDLRLNDLLKRKRSLSAHMLAPPENRDGDAMALFSGIVDEAAGSAAAETPDGSPPAERTAATGTAAPVATDAPVADTAPADALSPAAGQPAGAPQEAGGKVSPPATALPYQCPEGTDVDILMAFRAVEGRRVDKVVIEDPYCMNTATNRQCTAKFILALTNTFGRPRQVSLTFRPPYDLSGDVGTPEDAHRHLMQMLAVAFRSTRQSPPMLQWQTRRSTREQDFHDRFVRFETGPDLTEDRFVFLLSGGIDRLMQPRFNVHVIPIPAG
jgi:hypothetical protein|tara:strand:- start:534 stop:4157 length:3624 start_codon:yes stop_codon:yes gene_type:complete